MYTKVYGMLYTVEWYAVVIKRYYYYTNSQYYAACLYARLHSRPLTLLCRFLVYIVLLSEHMFTSVYECLQNPVQDVWVRSICSIYTHVNNSLFASKAIGLLVISFVSVVWSSCSAIRTHIHIYIYIHVYVVSNNS